MEKEKEILSEIQKKHAKLNPEEQNLLAQVVLAIKNGRKNDLEIAKERFLNLLEQNLKEFFGWDVQPLQQKVLRQKFLNLAGLYNIIPHADIMDMLGRVYHKVHRTITDVIPDDIFAGEHIIDAVTLKHIDPLSFHLSKVQKTVGVSYLDYVSGNRDNGVKPVINSIIFSHNIAKGNSAETYLSASSEPLTKTIYISTHTQGSEIRDLIGMGFDIVTQSSFIDFYYHMEETFNITAVLRNSMIIGTRYVENALGWIEDHLEKKEYQKEIEQLINADRKVSIEAYIHYLEQDLMSNNINLLYELNEKIGFARDDFKIHV